MCGDVHFYYVIALIYNYACSVQSYVCNVLKTLITIIHYYCAGCGGRSALPKTVRYIHQPHSHFTMNLSAIAPCQCVRVPCLLKLPVQMPYMLRNTFGGTPSPLSQMCGHGGSRAEWDSQVYGVFEDDRRRGREVWRKQ